MKIHRTLLLTTATLAIASVPAAAAAQYTCGGTIAADTAIVADTDLTCPDPNNPVLILGSDVDLDLDGHTITCDGGQPGIIATGSGSTIKNGVIRGCFFGINLTGAGKHEVEDVVIQGVYEGVVINTGSDGNKLEGVLINDTGDDAFDVASGKNKFTDCVAIDADDDGFDFDGEKNTIKESVAMGLIYEPDSGFEISNDKTVLVGNFAAFNDDGYLVSPDGGDAGHKLVKNYAILNDGDGFFSIASKAALTKNVSLLNANFGFGTGGPDNKLTSNVAVGNDSNGVDFGLALGAKVSKNRSIANNGNGFVTQAGAGGTFVKNDSVDNCGSGFASDSFSPSTWSKNRSQANCEDGISMRTGSVGNVIKQNTAFFNDLDGIYLETTGHDVTKNVAFGNAVIVRDPNDPNDLVDPNDPNNVTEAYDMNDTNALCTGNNWASNAFGSSIAGTVLDDACIQ